MYKNLKVGVAIPCYNVEGQVGNVLDQIPEFVDLVVPVDDCSTDGTKRVLESRAGGRIQPRFHDKNTGVGGAVITGWDHCLEQGMGVLVKLDGDGQVDPDKIVTLLERMLETGAPYVKANRFLHAAELEHMPLTRKIGNIVLTFLTKVASGYWHIFDPQNGFIAIESECYSLLNRERIAKRYFFENSMLINLNVFSVPATDVAVPAKYADETSSLSITDTMLTFPVYLMKGFFYRVYQRYVLRDFSPIIVLLLLGVLLTGFGFAFGIVKLLQYRALGTTAPTGNVITAALPIILGYQSILQAFLLDVINSPKPLHSTWKI